MPALCRANRRLAFVFASNGLSQTAFSHARMAVALTPDFVEAQRKALTPEEFELYLRAEWVRIATATKFAVMSIPTLLLFKDGEVVGRLVGARPKGAMLQEITNLL